MADSKKIDKTYMVIGIKEIKDKFERNVSALDLWFPHVSKAIVCAWGTRDFHDYTDTLISSTRPNRKGFPLGVLTEISDIVEAHNETFPQHEPEAKTYL